MNSEKDGVGMVNDDDDMKGLGDDLFNNEKTLVEDGNNESQGIKLPSGGVSQGKVLTPQQKAIRTILRRSGKDKIPELRQLMSGKWGTEVAVKDISIFINDIQGDKLMSDLSKQCPLRNRINLSAEVIKRRVLEVGVQIVEAGKMYQPIAVAKIVEDGRLECTSGRHRLAFIAMVFGPDARIPVYIEDMSLNEARDAVVVSNQARNTKALERAEHSVLQAVHGDSNASQDDLYRKTVTAKSKARRYCVFSVINRGYPQKLSFLVSTDSSRKGGLTTLANIENYWSAAVTWKKGMERSVFDADVKESVKFLNALVEKMKEDAAFNSKQQLASMVLVAIGKYYKNYKNTTGAYATEVADKVANKLVSMGDIGRQKSEKTYAALIKDVPLK